MKRTVAKFEKVSKEQFKKDVEGLFPEGVDVDKLYNAVGIPFRATEGSAGHDFFTPFEFELQPGEEILIPTGIRAKIDPEWALFLMPKSGLGFKFKLRLNNTIGLIDSDYYNADNEGHIMAKIRNEGDKVIKLDAGKGFMQGVFLQFGITEDDNFGKEKRSGGFGSTDAKAK